MKEREGSRIGGLHPDVCYWHWGNFRSNRSAYLNKSTLLNQGAFLNGKEV